MAVNSGNKGIVEAQIFSYLTKTAGYNTAVACGILANIEAESGFNPKAVGDNGTSYGLAQWHKTRRTNLYKFTGSYTPSVSQQMDFLLYELKNTLSAEKSSFILNNPNTAQGAYNTAYYFCYYFEIPADKENKSKERGNVSNKYWTYWANPNNATSSNIPTPVDNVGNEIIKVAHTCLKSPYKFGGQGPNDFDDAGLVYYCYTKAGVSIPTSTPQGYYDTYKDTARIVDVLHVCAGDLLFYEETSAEALTRYGANKIKQVAIADGKGGKYISRLHTGVVYETWLGTPSYILRILSDAEVGALSYGTGGGSDIENNIAPNDYANLSMHDPYSELALLNLEKLSVSAEGYDYGYLIDLTNGGEFRFYVPEFTEQAGANWSDVNIRGRSVTIKSYDSTNSRSISVSLALYAGVGLYKATSSEDGPATVDRLHRDANFLKSLEYPDYSNAITQPPPTVQLILGAAVNIVGIVNGVSVEHMKPVDDRNRAMYLKVSFTVTQIATNPIDVHDVRNGQYTLTSTSDIESISVGETLDDVTNAPVFTENIDEFGIIRGTVTDTELKDFGVGGSDS